MTKVHGPQPTKVDLRLLTNRGSRRRAAPVPAAAMPQPPSWYDTEHRQTWDRVTSDLSTMGLLARADESLICAYVVATVTHDRAARLLATDGLVTWGARGMVKHPAATIINQAAHSIDQLGASLGLSPSARARLATKIRADESDYDKGLRDLYA